MKKSEKKISKIVSGVKSEVKHFGKKWGLADTRKPDDGLGRKIPVLHYTVVYTSPFAAQLAMGICNHFVQQPEFKMFRNLIAFHPSPHR